MGRQSDGLFDLMDLFNMSLHFAGIAGKVPAGRYIDGIDQTMRMYECKSRLKVVEEKAQWLNIDMTTISDVGLAPWLFNLYIDPKEEYPVGHRMNAFLASMAAEMKGHAATFKKYPPKDVGLGR